MDNAEAKTGKSRQIDDAMITQAIEMIAASPFAKRDPGPNIVNLLRHWHARHRIRYAPPLIDSNERGTCINTDDSKEITVNEEYRGNLKVTVPTLVHEGTHATWRHKFSSDREAALCRAGEDEYLAQVNEVTVYKWLRDEKGYPKDFELELRLKRFEEGTLRAIVMANITGKDDPHCPVGSPVHKQPQ